MNVILQGDGSPFGVLEVDSRSEGEFGEHGDDDVSPKNLATDNDRCWVEPNRGLDESFWIRTCLCNSEVCVLTTGRGTVIATPDA